MKTYWLKSTKNGNVFKKTGFSMFRKLLWKLVDFVGEIIDLIPQNYFK